MADYDPGSTVTPSKQEGKKKEKAQKPTPGSAVTMADCDPGSTVTPSQQEGKKKEKAQKPTPGSGKSPSKKEDKKGEHPKGKAVGGPPSGSGTQQQKVELAGSSTDTGAQLNKAEMKKQRREKQEQQRAEKNKVKEAGPSKKETMPRVPDSIKADVAETQKRVAKKLMKQQIPKRTSAQRKVRLFDHLQQYERGVSLTQSMQFSCSGLHPAIIRLGLQYAEGVISGSNARCIALLAALRQVIDDYSTPPKEELCRDLTTKIKPYISFLNQCRPLSVSMGNAIKYLKWHINQTPGTMTDSQAKQQLFQNIDDFRRERITLAATAISAEAATKIENGDVILVYSCSSLIRRVLCDAHKQGKQFKVIVADSRPKMEGKETLRRLVKEGIKCSYVLINTVAYVMTEATKVLLGAHALLANGFMMSRVGSSLISLIAKSSNVPVLVCCETYKFCERVQTDSFVFNELGDPDDLVDIGGKSPYLCDWRGYSSLTLLNLVYDFTPPEFIACVITELGMIPCTSVPVVLRMKQAEINET